MRILLQFPEGLKQYAMKYMQDYERKGHEVFLSASPCYGACDLCLDEAKWLKADKIVHFGHNRFIKKKLPGISVEYVPYRIDFDVNVLANALPVLRPYKKIAIATTVQYSNQIRGVAAFLKKNGKTALLGKGKIASEEGQVLGCDAHAVASVAKGAEAVLFIGEGLFHPLAIDLELPVFSIHPKSGAVTDLSPEITRLRKKRRGSLLAALDAKSFGIIASTKPGQFSIGLARWAKKELEKRGKKTAILVANEIEPRSLSNFLAFNCYVTTACPRMADDTEEFGKPVLDLALLKEFLKLEDATRP